MKLLLRSIYGLLLIAVAVVAAIVVGVWRLHGHKDL